ncbi:cysteine desulfurase family protein [[Actinomadura] parvosata]|uniref:cysteine desulfurase family protein n=1 Tax=[Actinomadura] parvosata TaxID=1955412 RepID=UPI00406CB950
MTREFATLPIYLDYHATTPVDPRVAAIVLRVMTADFGNANSTEHVYGDVAAELVDEARGHVAALVGAAPETVNFTSGSTESIRLAIGHAVSVSKKLPLRVAATTVEHRAVLDALAAHEARGEAVVHWLPVDRRGKLDLEMLEHACRQGTDLVCVMAANNEVGVIYPVEQVGQITARFGARSLIDATQAAGHLPIRAQEWNITYLALSAHKMYGPKGVGALVAPRGFDARSSYHRVSGVGEGTPNVPGIAGLGEACRLRDLEHAADEKRMAAQRDRLESLLLPEIDGLVVNGDPEHRLSNNLHIAIPGVPNNAVIARLRRRVALSSGAACSSGAETPSHVLQAMGLPYEIQGSALRISNGKFTTDEEIECAAEQITSAVASVRHALKGVMA